MAENRIEANEDDVALFDGGAAIGFGLVMRVGGVLVDADDGAVVGEQAMTAAGSVVTPGTQIPPRTLAAGSPAVVKKELSGAALQSVEHSTAAYHHLRDHYLQHHLDDPHTALKWPDDKKWIEFVH